jgi:branched-subunit amino acid aminotransferase/4-amino-4-deoxychorismate lyase
VEENQGQLHTWNLIISSWRIAADDQLGAAKTSNKLRQVLARAEAEAHQAHEALLLNTAGEVAEGSSANLFWIESGVVCTPPLSSGALPGVTRGVVMELCQQRKICCQEQSCPLERLRDAAGIFLTFSSLGIVEAVSLNGKPLARSPLTRQLHTAYHQLLARESDTA